MERNKEQWINKTLNSLDGIQAAVPSAHLHKTIIQRIQDERRRIISDAVQSATIYRIAAAILVVVVINVFTCVTVSKNLTKQKQLQYFAKQYSLSDTGDGLLNM